MFKITLKVSNEDGQDVGITDEFEVVVPRRVLPGNKLISTIVDNETIYNNPSMGWVQYYEFQDTDVDKYWAEMDELYAQGLKTNILYIRNPWSWYEPSEGNYAWNDPDSRLSKLIYGSLASISGAVSSVRSVLYQLAPALNTYSGVAFQRIQRLRIYFMPVMRQQTMRGNFKRF